MDTQNRINRLTEKASLHAIQIELPKFRPN